MRLENIKLAGFKSFVDPTKVPFPSRITGIVGPNGCGKSNVIDAVRWVMGESSAKNLRGESLTDVIFNGSVNRKPVGQASIELNFDNSDGSLGGEYAAFNQISIKRQINRDGQSIYFLNGTRCRRRDITDVFLGTGLGPRSYSIIQQGTVSRLIEAKPEEMRVYLEEVAGISKYKERRRETENRIRRTRENLERLTDLREELDKQLSHLKRQANAAERYKFLKEEERLLKARLQALRIQRYETQLAEKNKVIQTQEVELESQQAQLRHIDAAIESVREAHTDCSDQYNEVQGRYYQLGADISKLEQALQHNKERQEQLKADINQTTQSLTSLNEHINTDQTQINELNNNITQLTPEYELAQEASEQANNTLSEVEETVHAWQTKWDDFNHQAATTSQQAQVMQTRIQHLEEQINQLAARKDKTQEELKQIDCSQYTEALNALKIEIDQFEQQAQDCQAEVASIQQQINEQREHNHQITTNLDEARSQLQQMRGRQASLEALQQAAVGQQDDPVVEWLQVQQLNNNPRLAQSIKVENGWEQAAETVLGFYLEAICVDDSIPMASALNALNKGQMALIGQSNDASSTQAAHNQLLSKIQSKWSLDSLLASIYIADDINAAKELLSKLASHESVVTPEGLWLGHGWMRINRATDERAGVLKREKELTALISSIEQQQEKVEAGEQSLIDGRTVLDELEQKRNTAEQAVREVSAQLADAKAQMRVKETRLEHMKQRMETLQQESTEHELQRQTQQQELNQARISWQESMSLMDQHADMRDTLQTERNEHRERLEDIRQRAQSERNKVHEINLTLQSAQTQLQALQQNIGRMQQQLSSAEQRQDQLQQSLQSLSAPQEEMQLELEDVLAKRLLVEEELNEAKIRLDNIEHQVREYDTQRHEVEDKLDKTRQKLEKLRLDWQSLQVRSNTVREQLAETDFTLETLLQEMPEDAEEQAYEAQLETITQRIQRLGAINLAAIDEFATQSERKIYLDAQNEDLESALATLESAISKIDKETRSRFKETFDKVNAGLQHLFPKVFGGGQAYLELTGDDLLNAGIAIMAQPPGKKNSTIHLLSGGEKALTAISLVFSLFQLNPAPFCMLDEVDAPLDDANVMRFCNLVKEMSKKVQFIIISHNKVTIEISEHLAGVTMHEPGVSRLVAVDIDEAVALAEA